MAECECGNWVRHDGEECRACFADRFRTYAENRDAKTVLKEFELEQRRAEFESDYPHLFCAEGV